MSFSEESWEKIGHVHTGPVIAGRKQQRIAVSLFSFYFDRLHTASVQTQLTPFLHCRPRLLNESRRSGRRRHGYGVWRAAGRVKVVWRSKVIVVFVEKVGAKQTCASDLRIAEQGR